MLRGAGLGEALWTPRKDLDWEDFLKRLKYFRACMDAAKLPYWWEEETTAVKTGAWKAFTGEKILTVDLDSIVDKTGYYEVLFHYRTGPGTFILRKAEMLENGQVISCDEHTSIGTLAPRCPNQFYILEVPDFKKGAKYSVLEYPFADQHKGIPMAPLTIIEF